MTWRVVLSPSGRELQVEPGATILEAALRDGIALSYHCVNGSCGACRARIIEGVVVDSLHHDYTFKGTDKLHPMLLMCCAKPGSDMVIEALEATSVKDIPQQCIMTTVARCERVRDHVMVLHLRTPRSQTLRFLAGQHVSLQLDDTEMRDKSIASCPCNGRELQFHFRRIPGDALSEYVFDHLKPRDTVVVEGPYGDFVLDEQAGRPIIFVAFETGFAPIKSLIEHAISLEWTLPMQLYWFANDACGHYLENYCRSWSDVLDDFCFTLITGLVGEGVRNESDAILDAQCAHRIVDQVVRDNSDLSIFDIYIATPKSLYPVLQRAFQASAATPARIFLNNMQRY